MIRAHAPASPLMSRRSPIRLFRLLTSLKNDLYPTDARPEALWVAAGFSAILYPVRFHVVLSPASIAVITGVTLLKPIACSLPLKTSLLLFPGALTSSISSFSPVGLFRKSTSRILSLPDSFWFTTSLSAFFRSVRMAYALLCVVSSSTASVLNVCLSPLKRSMLL